MNKIVKNKILGYVVIGFLFTACIYLCISLYFINNFNLGTSINGISISGLSVNEANEKIKNEIESYKLILQGRDGVVEEIKAVEIGLEYEDREKLKELKVEQNSLGWLLGIFNKSNEKNIAIWSCKMNLLEKRVEKLSFFDQNNIVNPKDVTFEYTENGYIANEEIYGNKVKKEVLYDHVLKAIRENKKMVVLDEIECYENPRYTLGSQEVINIRNTLNKFVFTNITYTFGESTEILDSSIINQWLSVNKNLEILINEDKIREFVNTLAKKYNTVGINRVFKNSLGSYMNIEGGYYGWKIDIYAEVCEIIKNIKDGKDIIREPIFLQRAEAHGKNDIGDTYVEISIENQHLWFYKDGKIVTQGDVVTGNVSRNLSTPLGVYMLNYKEKNTVLKGHNYESEVKYWMPFNGNIGIHDASWRHEFGRDIYLSKGSHGCVNVPEYLAKILYENIESNTPIICY